MSTEKTYTQLEFDFVNDPMFKLHCIKPPEDILRLDLREEADKVVPRELQEYELPHDRWM